LVFLSFLSRSKNPILDPYKRMVRSASSAHISPGQLTQCRADARRSQEGAMLVRLFLGFCMVIPRGDGGNAGVVIVTV
jgi:hypothetical protein